MSSHEITRSDAIWQDLVDHAEQQRRRTISSLFSEDKNRFSHFSVRFEDLVLDSSKNLISREIWELLLDLARAAKVEESRDAMFNGDHVNSTENRAALHTAMRDLSDDAIVVDGVDVKPWILDRFSAASKFCDGVRDGSILGALGEPFTDVVSIGIGGSDLGTKMTTQALSPFVDGPRIHSVSNIDGCQLADVLAKLNPSSTLVVITSKTFSTSETIRNAQSAKKWLEAALGEEKSRNHLIAVTAVSHAARSFGINSENIFVMKDWVGGRVSIWSAAGLCLQLALGSNQFRQFLSGANAIDRHFMLSPLSQNMPVMLALTGIWNRNFMGYSSQVVCPYDYRLERFPTYLQQLEMESNGKSVRQNGNPVRYPTGVALFGVPGTDAQHSIFQMLHQGTDIIPVDFLVGAQPVYRDELLPAAENHHRHLVSNCFAQAMCLMSGYTAVETSGPAEEDEMRRIHQKHRSLAGSRPSNMLMYRKLDPKTLGMIIALYEHKTFVQSLIWDINCFDQFGVEHGKKLAGELARDLRNSDIPDHVDESTAGLIAAWYELRGDLQPESSD